MLKTTDICPVTAAFELDKGEESFRKFLRINQIGVDHYYNSDTLLLNEISVQSRVALLLKLGANILLPTKDKYQLTALHMAAKCYKDQSLNLFLVDLKRSGRIEEGINIKDAKGNTPLHYACITAHEKSIDLLLEYGADVSAPNSEGKRPIDCLDELKRLDATQRANLEQKLKSHTASNNTHEQQKGSTPTHAVKKVIPPQSSAEKSPSPLPVSAIPQKESENFDRDLALLVSERMLRESPATQKLNDTIEKIRTHANSQTKQPLFKFDQVDINRERLTLDLSERAIQMHLKDYRGLKRKGQKLLDPTTVYFARIYVVLEHLILSLDLEKIVELEKILDDEAELLWKSGFNSGKSRTFSRILCDIKLPGPVADQNGLSPANYARSKLLPWFEWHRNCPAAVRIYGELDDFEKAIKILSKKSAPSDAVIQMIKRTIEQTCRTGYEQSEAVKEYVNSKINPAQQQQVQSAAVAIPTPPVPPKPVQRRNSMDRTQSPTTFFGPARQKTPSPPRDGSLSGSPGSGEDSPKSLPNRTVLRRDLDLELFQACHAGNVDLARELLEVHHANPNPGHKNKLTLMHYAAISGNLSLAQLLVKHSSKVDLPNEDGTTPLMYALLDEHTHIALYLLDNGADPYARCSNGEITPFAYAMDYDNFEVINKMVELKVDLNKPLRDNFVSPLTTAIIRGNLNMVKLFVNNGADLTYPTMYKGEEFTPLYAVITSDKREITEYFEGLDQYKTARKNVSVYHSEKETQKCLVM